ncbi:TRAP transporter large permease [Rhodococcus sp. NPDC057297]|uniref:TRAP transporter large permease n=1 Tax=Rhodococcus sp. NPDC057297 TaxID=3346090 RepID=UPI003630303E
MTALALAGLLIVLILAGIPVTFAIMAAGLVGLVVIGRGNIIDGVMETLPAASVTSFTLTAIPLFILMAQLVLLSGLLDSLFDAARSVVGRVRGGTGMAAVGAGTAFAAVSGSSTASAATLAYTSTGKMIEEGYHPRTASGMIAVVGTLAAMIPPSIALVFYAITAGTSVGDQLIAGFFPGLLVALAIVLTMYVTILRNVDSVPRGTASTMSDKAVSIAKASPILILFGAVVGSIYFGVATPTEAAAVGCLAAFGLAIVYRRATLEGLIGAVTGTVKSTAMILAIIVSAHVFGHFITETRVAPAFANWVETLTIPALGLVLVIGLFYVVLGFFMDQIAIIALTVPIVVPIVETLGYDPIWFGILMVLLAEIGLVTPPLGLNVFVVSRSSGRPVEEVFRGAFPYVVAMLLLAVGFCIWPDIVLWVVQ